MTSTWAFVTAFVTHVLLWAASWSIGAAAASTPLASVSDEASFTGRTPTVVGTLALSWWPWGYLVGAWWITQLAYIIGRDGQLSFAAGAAPALAILTTAWIPAMKRTPVVAAGLFTSPLDRTADVWQDVTGDFRTGTMGVVFSGVGLICFGRDPACGLPARQFRTAN